MRLRHLLIALGVTLLFLILGLKVVYTQTDSHFAEMRTVSRLQELHFAATRLSPDEITASTCLEQLVARMKSHELIEGDQKSFLSDAWGQTLEYEYNHLGDTTEIVIRSNRTKGLLRSGILGVKIRVLKNSIVSEFLWLGH